MLVNVTVINFPKGLNVITCHVMHGSIISQSALGEVNPSFKPKIYIFTQNILIITGKTVKQSSHESWEQSNWTQLELLEC